MASVLEPLLLLLLLLDCESIRTKEPTNERKAAMTSRFDNYCNKLEREEKREKKKVMYLKDETNVIVNINLIEKRNERTVLSENRK